MVNQFDLLDVASKDELVFHYTTKETAVEKILPSIKIRMGRYENTKDPKENKEWAFTEPSCTNRQWSEKQLRSIVRLFCACKDRMKKALHAYGNFTQSPIEVRGFGLPRMWAQYGEEHRGVCLAFDRELLSSEISTQVQDTKYLCRGSVSYKILDSMYSTATGAHNLTNESTRSIAHARDHVRNHAQMLLLTKNLDWRGEREFRWVYLAEEFDPELYIPIGKSLKAVILGVDFPKTREYLDMMRVLCRKKNVSLHGMRCLNGIYSCVPY